MNYRVKYWRWINEQAGEWYRTGLMTEDEYFESLEYALTDLDAAYPCPDVDCDGIVEYEATGYWQCSECSFRTKHIENRTKLQGWRL